MFRARHKLTSIALLACALSILIYSFLVFLHVANHPFKGFYVFRDCKVIEVSPNTEAARAGLRRGDKIVEINGKRVRSLVDYLALSNNLKIGERVKVVTERRGNRLPIELTVLKHPFPYHALVWLIMGLAGAVAGFTIYATHPEENGAALFCLISVCAIGAFIGGVNWFILVDNFFLLSIFIITGTMLTPLATHFCLVFPERKAITLRRRWFVPALYLPHVAFLVAVEAMNIRAYTKYIDGESLRHVFSVMAIMTTCYFGLVGIYLLGCLLSIIHSYRATTSSEAERRLKWIFWASSAAAIPFGFAAFTAFTDFERFAFGGATLWILMGSALLLMGQAFSITKYRLSDIDSLINKSVVYFLVSGVTIAGYYSVIFVGGLLLSALVGESSFAARILAILTIAIIFRPISEIFQSLVDRKFFPERYQHEKTILEVSNAITSILDLDRLIEKIVSTVRNTLRIKFAWILLKDESGAFAFRPESTAEGTPALTSESPLVQQLLKERKPVVRSSGQVEDERVVAELKRNSAAVALPIIFEDDLIGIFLLGEKLSGDVYSSREISLLRTLANEAALAIRNARSYTTIQRLNRELAEKVKRIENQHEQILSLQRQLVDENRYLKEEIRERYNFREIVGSSSALKEVLRMVEKVARTQSVVLIRGESGTGKELIARAIHFNSDRRDKPFVKVNCAALSEGVLESELFGHERGSFTGAIRKKVGKFELANGGTIFLDEIGDISLNTQVKLLRVLQEKEFERVGGNETVRVDVRVIASTNRDLETALRDGHFREDLFYRLNVITIFVPPLRERREDICELALHFLNRFNKEVGKNIRSIDDEAMQMLMEYDWPGNVRELQNMIERAVVLAEGESITVDDLPFKYISRKSPQPRSNALPGVLDAFERDRLKAALEEFNGNKSQAARSLGLKRTTFISKLKKYGLA